MRSVEIRHDVLLGPARATMEFAIHLAFFARDASGDLDGLRLRRRYGTSGLLQDPPDTVQALPEAIYGGFLYNQFGHFILEGLARYWFLRAQPDRMVVFHSRQRRFLPWQAEILGLLGLAPERLTLVNDGLRIGRLEIPAAGFEIGVRADADHIRGLGVFRPPPRGAAEEQARLWLSRSALGPGSNGYIENEDRLEAALESTGWRIFRPEAHPVAEQLRVLGSAREIAGLEGSAFHALALLERCDGAVSIIPRGPRLAHEFGTLLEAKGIRFRVPQAEFTVLGGKHRRTSFRLENAAALAAQLEADSAFGQEARCGA